ncbi:MAG: DUF308 domain-containing protein [Muribaculaceae bacterium]|nr:DUF308 domain-containing protein [Muribaculaceae bacterium]
MNTKFNYYCANLVIVAIGVLLIVFHQHLQLMEYIMMLVGAMFVIPASISLISIFVSRSKPNGNNADISHSISAIGALAIGLFMIIKPIVFVGIATYLLAALLVIGGLYQLIILLSGARTFRFPIWFYIAPLLILVAGVVILASSVREIQSTVVLITGIGFILFAFNNLLEGSRQKQIES